MVNDFIQTKSLVGAKWPEGSNEARGRKLGEAADTKKDLEVSDLEVRF